MKNDAVSFSLIFLQKKKILFHRVLPLMLVLLMTTVDPKCDKLFEKKIIIHENKMNLSDASLDGK